MNIAFTICSNNYLAKAKIVADTFLSFHIDYKFSIFLVDRLDNQLDYTRFANTEIIEIHSVVSGIQQLAEKYNIIELNTAVKPEIFLYLFDKNKSDIIIYLDPDLMIFDCFNEVKELFEGHNQNVVLTPHFCSPIDDGKYPSEIDFACFGLYNLGFIAVRNTSESTRFLNWWRERLVKYCYVRPEQGMFTDQLWVNLAPIFFKGMYILKHLGYNVANWNLYERQLNSVNGRWHVNANDRLKFFHFSQYEYDNPYSISKFQKRHTVSERPDIKSLIDEYQKILVQNKFEEFNKSSCFYHQVYLDHASKVRSVESSFLSKVKGRLNRYICSIKRTIFYAKN